VQARVFEKMSDIDRSCPRLVGPAKELWTKHHSDHQEFDEVEVGVEGTSQFHDAGAVKAILKGLVMVAAGAIVPSTEGWTDHSCAVLVQVQVKVVGVLQFPSL
jgi:hypothetical protein